MRMFFISVMIVCFSSLVAMPCHAKKTQEYIQWAKGEFEIPTEIRKAASLSELRPFLNSRQEFARMAAVRRLGEIEGRESIGLLLESFEKEKPPTGLHDVPLVKLEIVRALERIDGEEAKSALLNILKDYWRTGPEVKDKRAFAIDRDFAPVVNGLLKSLYRWSHDEDVFQTAKEIALSKDTREFYTFPEGVGEGAWKVYLKGEMIRKQIVKGKQSAIYLLDFLDNARKNGAAYGTLGSVKVGAARSIFEEEISDSTLFSVKREFEEELKHIERFEPNGNPTERYKALVGRVGYIDTILKEESTGRHR